jgi:hypothetical protein
LHFASPSPPSGWAEDFHLQAAEHAQHTTKPLARQLKGGSSNRLLSGRIMGLSKPNPSDRRFSDG